MEIKLLQSLIDRTSNQIAEYEACIRYVKDYPSYDELAPWELDQINFTISYYNQRLPKLREIQKALKKEIAGAFLWEMAYKEGESGRNADYTVEIERLEDEIDVLRSEAKEAYSEGYASGLNDGYEAGSCGRDGRYD